MKYDDAEYYFIDFESDLPKENGGRHMGLFLEWAIRHGLANEELMAQAAALRNGSTTGLKLLFEHCDGKLLDTDLNEEGNAFAGSYYEAHHMRDFIEAMNLSPDKATVDEIFGANLTPQRHARVLWQLDRRYSDWRRQFGLPDREALLERALAIIEPAVAAAGFLRAPASMWGTVEQRATFERSGAWGRQRLDLIAVDNPKWFYGLRAELSVHINGLYEAILAEKTLDQGSVTSLQDSAVLRFVHLAQGWPGLLQDYGRDRGFWIFRETEITPLAQWLADRLRTFALPTLRNLDCVDALALAYGTRPMAASPIYDPGDPYPALLSAEQARHPRLGAMLSETETAIRAGDAAAQTYGQATALSLIQRIRKRAKAWL